MSDGERRRKLVERIPLTAILSECMLPHQHGASRRFLCPFHDDSHATFELDPAARQFHCRDCGASGDVVDFVRMYEGVTDPEALHLLESRPTA